MSSPVDKVIAKLEQFIKDKDARNLWIEVSGMQVYVRKSFRAFGSKSLDNPLRQNCLDIASIEISPKNRGKGLFSEFMRRAEELNPFSCIYLEQVSNAILHKYCNKHAWILEQGSESCYFKQNR